jgi:hypothetical protein
MTVTLRAAFYLRVSTARQAEHDVSIPDQRRQGESYCTSRGYRLVETYVEPGASATNDRRPEFQRMKSDLLRTLAAISGVKSATGGVRSSVLDWRRECQSTPIER